MGVFCCLILSDACLQGKGGKGDRRRPAIQYLFQRRMPGLFKSPSPFSLSLSLSLGIISGKGPVRLLHVVIPSWHTRSWLRFNNNTFIALIFLPMAFGGRIEPCLVRRSFSSRRR